MEALIALVVLVLLLVPVLLVVALVMISGLRRRVAALEQQRLDATAAWPETPIPTAQPLARTEQPYRPAAPTAPVAVPAVAAATTVGAVDLPPPLPPLAPPAAAAVAPPPPPAGPGLAERLLGTVKQWFTEGNVPVKIGMLVLLAGVAALLKYASDQGWLNAPIELRLAAIAAGALGGLVFGWIQRDRRRLFALALQGGTIGILLLTIFAAFKRYDLIDALPAFAMSVLLIAGIGVLAVLQNSRTLAVLGILAGFMAPIWLSTGSGNHVALFSYYAVLNGAILAIAWWRPWRVLNLLGFAFTFGIGTAWGVLQYQADKFASTEPFLLLFFAFYLLIPILYARRQPAEKRDLVDGSLVFGTPLIAFSLQAGMLHQDRLLLALCALALATLYAALGWALIRRPRYAALGQSHAVLAVGFATLAVPLALSARATAGVFALEGAALAWLGLRQRRWLPQIAAALLQLGAAFGFVVGADYWHNDANAIANPTFMSGLLLAVAGFASAWSYRRARQDAPALVYYLWGLLWWLGGAVHEVGRFVVHDSRPDALLIAVAVTAWIAAEVHRRAPARALALTTLAMLLSAFPLALWQADVHQQPFAGYGALAWAVFAALGVRSLWCLRDGQDRAALAAQFSWWLLWPTVLSLACMWLADRFGLAQGWSVALALLPWLLLAGVALLRWPWLAVPLGARFDVLRQVLTATVFVVLGVSWLCLLFAPASAVPLPWLPLLNPMELAQLAVLALAVRWLWSVQAPRVLGGRRVPLLAIAGFILLTSTTLHTVHHWGAVPWNDRLWSSTLAQTSLTVVWSVLGVISWVWGSRRGQRTLWLVGAVLMGVVLAKLVLIDRQHLGNLLGISSFIAYGLLCTVVGYLAPAPPRAPDADLEQQP
ncbi:DUF2339 domain-containing protein [Stenotrophomonas rhizophila]|uniref:DUF2339 domain-containing protein n=1 Tax=Stenotrophomonas rhizophila TaxID=216778 RepID=UPI001E55228A|nr:DUF2339 domain-containing protein [Stenotrophomonas rhizophila]MCC7635817.1 DUF2339 domain-containing protein [Stenotrophomonas rhizophila]MCC7665084.1 DUF2339 domain-containing protein [Stenotrophomonas rhizophila]